MAENNNNNPMMNDENGKPKMPRFNVYWVYIIIILGFFLIQYFYSGKTAQLTTWQEVKNQMLEKQEISKLLVVRNAGKVEVYLKEDKLEKYKDRLGQGFGAVPKAGPHFYFTIGSIETFERQLAEAQTNIEESQKIYPEYVDRPNYWADILSWVLPFVILAAIWIYIFRRISRGGGGGPGGGNIFSVGKSKAQLFDKETRPRVDFKDVAGLEEAKIEVMEIVDFLKNPKKYTELGGKIPKGALLVGPPGTGKTLLAKAVAGEANVPFFSMSGSEFVEMFVGVGASRVRDLFRQAKEKAPCIVFIDEIDAIGRARGKNPSFSGNDERENTLNQLLTEMDGFASNQGVIILAATNRADILDRALLRAGRFDRQIHVELPDLKERLDIFKVHLRPLKLEENLDISFLAKQTPGFSGADIANVCNEAALIAARKNKKYVEKQDFLDAIDRIIGGLEKKNKIISKEERRTIAYHEAGHATVSWLLEHANPLLKVSIIPRGRSLGAAWYLPEERQITTTEQLFDEMCSTLGGRAAEEINFNKISTGALSDLERVTKQAYAMVAYFGMGKNLRNISYYDSTGQVEFTFSKPYSEKTAEQIDEEVKEIIDKAYERAKQILTENHEGHVQLAELLLEREVIFSEDLEKIFGPRKTLSREQELVKELDEEAHKQNSESKENQTE
ncbi:MAG: ATP-dependent zinc metalloprotease FtsH [Tenuifilum sp.]|uniref:ATP-dependent zinc metalloprotease FtsH n=1 Tax=Tenuifilum sp. TaxID=2760880 RepID=UPI002BCA4FC6|nr:ATP-dependent zinc metalloprotease FtsH [Tenuifilum sp.]HOK85334.1 ATP-dependent zinc metalloprotease FtsH [Tenuifilum sp.]HON70877.1 ATP-dependent zinc metalloprotease FtsH [Tenuifilum sp.]HPP89664.1 ATP-dependent zinc metalloprotease FtsH [Tenuifilum sp.]HQE54679.1 ATP-dependent zinc metalloprotease FtsH [Tenuifilum sp.]